MDDIIKHLVETGGDTALKSAIGSALTGLAMGLKKVLSRKDKKAIEKTAERMVQLATLEDVERYDQKLRTIRYTTMIHSGPPGYGGPPEKATPKKVSNPAKKSVKKAVIFKKGAPKKVAIKKKAAPKRAVRKIISPR